MLHFQFAKLENCDFKAGKLGLHMLESNFASSWLNKKLEGIENEVAICMQFRKVESFPILISFLEKFVEKCHQKLRYVYYIYISKISKYFSSILLSLELQ